MRNANPGQLDKLFMFAKQYFNENSSGYSKMYETHDKNNLKSNKFKKNVIQIAYARKL